MTIINSNRLWTGIGIEILLALSIFLILYFIFTSGKIRKEFLSNRSMSKWSLWLVILLLLGVMFLTYVSSISNSVLTF